MQVCMWVGAERSGEGKLMGLLSSQQIFVVGCACNAIARKDRLQLKTSQYIYVCYANTY